MVCHSPKHFLILIQVFSYREVVGGTQACLNRVQGSLHRGHIVLWREFVDLLIGSKRTPKELLADQVNVVRKAIRNLGDPQS